MKIKNKYLAYFLLALLTGYLAWLYSAELKILSELNDNTFQFAMVQQTEEIFNQVLAGRLSFWSLFDFWNPIWGQGAALSFYYNHLPQLLIVFSYKIFHLFFSSLSLFKYFEILKYLVLILTPATFFWGSRFLGFGLWGCLGTALVSALINTCGSFGLDASSYLFAGFGLSSQLIAVFFMPLAFGKTFQFLSYPKAKSLFGAVIFNFLVIQSHLGTGIILLFSELTLLINFQSGKLNLKKTIRRGRKLLVLFLLTLITCGYFLIPMLIADAFRNFSAWEGLWKFNSFGWQKVIADFLNGQLFDYQRWPIMTALVILGFVLSLSIKLKFASLGIGFGFWLLAFFGRTTWGPLFNFLPGLKDFYLHRFITGVHFFGIFLAGLSLELIIMRLSKYIKREQIFALLFLVAFFFLLFPAPRNYAQNNQRLIKEANLEFLKDEANFQEILTVLNEKNPLGRRIFAGTPGDWGRTFTVGHTPVYQRLSVLGYPVMNFYAHSWSLSSQTEPFFEEANKVHCQLYNVGFFIVPDSYQIPFFARKIAQQGKYRLLELEESNYFTLAQAGPEFSANKNNFINLIHLWLQSDWPKKQAYPLLYFSNSNRHNQALQMLDLNHYFDPSSSQIKNLFIDLPFADLPQDEKKLSGKQAIEERANLNGQKFFASLNNQCPNCILVLSQSYHPNWEVKINSQKAEKKMVFPGFLAVDLNSGFREIEFSYISPLYKRLLLVISGASLISLLLFKCKQARGILKKHCRMY